MVTIPAADVASAGSAQVSVVNPTPSETSNTATFTVTTPPPASVSRYLLGLSMDNISVDAIVPGTGQLRAENLYALPNASLNYNFNLLMNPDGHIAYLVTSPSGLGLQLITYSVSASGVLTDLNATDILSSATTGVAPAVDPLGRFVYMAEYTGDIVVYPLDPNTGIPGSETTAVSGLTSSANSLVIDPTGNYLFALTGSTITSFQINSSTGGLTQIGSPAAAVSSLEYLSITPSGAFVYGLDGFNNSIYAFSASQGALTELTNSPFSVPSSGIPEKIAIDPSSSYLYLTNQSPDALYGYTIGSDGSLTPMQSGSSFPVGSNPQFLNVDAGGHYLYVNNRVSSEEWVYSIAVGTGLLTQTSKIRTQSATAQAISSGSTGLTFTPTTLYVTNNSTGAGGTISQLTIDPSTGELSQLAIPIGSGVAPKTVAVDPFDLYAYTPSSGDVYAFTTSNTGLAYLGTGLFSSGNGSSWLTTDLSGSYLYVTEQTDSTIWKYDLVSGVPTSGAETVTTDTGPVFIAGEASGQYLFTANTSSTNDGIQSFKIGLPGGGLSVISSVTTGASQQWIAVDPSGRFLYSADPTGGAVWEFTILSTGGIALNSPNQWVPAGPSNSTGVSSVVVEPSGMYLYAANDTLNQIFAYSIDPNTGELSDIHTSLPDSEAADTTATSPMALAVDISGKYLYCVNFGNNGSGNIDIFSIDPSTGLLTYVASYSGLQAPGALTTTGTVQ